MGVRASFVIRVILLEFSGKRNKVFVYLTPFIPLSFKGEGEDIKKRGFAPLKHPL